MAESLETKIRNFARSTALGRLLLMPVRLKSALTYTLPPVWRSFTWMFTSRENHNFTYNLTPLNMGQLVSFVAVVTGRDYATIEKYTREILDDEKLKAHVIRLSGQHREKYVSDRTARFGRRVGWYAIIRATKPKVAVETGVDKGLGTVAIAAALMKNAEEGFPGKLIGLDLNPNAGYLLQEPYSKYGTLIYGNSHDSILALKEEVDFFIHDSCHEAEFEAKEFELVKPKLSADALVLTDNGESTDELLKFANATGRSFLYFAEEPENHWAPPSGIGVAFNKPTK